MHLTGIDAGDLALGRDDRAAPLVELSRLSIDEEGRMTKYSGDHFGAADDLADEIEIRRASPLRGDVIVAEGQIDVRQQNHRARVRKDQRSGHEARSGYEYWRNVACRLQRNENLIDL